MPKIRIDGRGRRACLGGLHLMGAALVLCVVVQGENRADGQDEDGYQARERDHVASKQPFQRRRRHVDTYSITVASCASLPRLAASRRVRAEAFTAISISFGRMIGMLPAGTPFNMLAIDFAHTTMAASSTD